MSRPVYEWQPSTAEAARRAGITLDRVIRSDQNRSPDFRINVRSPNGYERLLETLARNVT